MPPTGSCASNTMNSATGDFLLKDKAGAVCLDCADLGHLEFCLPATPRSPGVPGKRADCPPSWCAGAHDAIAMSGKGFWPKRPRSNRPHKSASPTLTGAPAAGSTTRVAGPIRTCASAVSSPPLSVSSSRVVRSTVPRRSHFMRRRAAAAVWDEAPPGEPWTATLYASPSSPPSVMSTPTTTPCSCRVSTANRLEHKCTSVSRTSSTRGATVLRCSTDSRHTTATCWRTSPVRTRCEQRWSAARWMNAT